MPKNRKKHSFLAWTVLLLLFAGLAQATARPVPEWQPPDARGSAIRALRTEIARTLQD